MSESATEPRVYGNWSRPQSAGIAGLGLAGTVLMFGSVIVLVFLMMAGQYVVALLVGVVATLLLFMVKARDASGRTMVGRTMAAVGWSQAKAAKSHLYRSGPLGRAGWGTCQLPGIAARTSLTEWSDAMGLPFALIEAKSAGTYTIVFASEPEGAALVDDEQVDAWVSRWGHWLSSLSNEPGLESASVTIETAPDSGARLRRELRQNVQAGVPEFAQATMQDIEALYPAGSASIRAYVALTYVATPKGAARRRSAEDMARFLAPRISMLSQGLSATGAGAAHPVGAEELCEIVRVAYDPAAAPIIDDAHGAGVPTGLTWSDSGPAASQASWSNLRHDSALSVSWMMSEAPPSPVRAQALLRLLSPSESIPRKRVTFLYRPIDRGRAAQIVHNDVRDAKFNLTGSQSQRADDALQLRKARATEEEEAAGAGLLQFGMLITATVTEEQARAVRLEGERGYAFLEAQAESLISEAALSGHLQIRRVWGSQDAAFAAALPIGVNLRRHLRMPAELRDQVA